MIQGITNFTNPESLGFDLTFDFDVKKESQDTNTDKGKTNETGGKSSTIQETTNTGVKPNENTSETDSGDNTDTNETKPPVSVSEDELDSLFGFGADAKKDSNTDEGSQETTGGDERTEEYVKIINGVADVFGGKLVPYEGFSDEEVPSEDMLNKLIAHNLEIAQDSAVSEFVNSLSPKIQKLIDFDLNLESGDESKLQSYIESLIKTENISSLSLENVTDQEKIVRTFYQNEQWTEEEVNDKIKDLKDTNLLVKEATRLKPKLVAKYEESVREKEQKEREAKEIDVKLKQEFNKEMAGIVSKGKINDIPLTQDEVKKVMAYLSTDTKEYRTPTGGVKEMTPIEAIINYYRYAQGVDKTILAEVAFYLSDPKGFKDKFSKKIESELKSTFVKEQKYNTKSLSGLNVDKREEKPAAKQEAPKWKLKI